MNLKPMETAKAAHQRGQIIVYFSKKEWLDIINIIDQYVDANNQVNGQAKAALDKMQTDIERRCKENESFLSLKDRIVANLEPEKTDGKRDTSKPKAPRRRN